MRRSRSNAGVGVRKSDSSSEIRCGAIAGKPTLPANTGAPEGPTRKLVGVLYPTLYSPQPNPAVIRVASPSFQSNVACALLCDHGRAPFSPTRQAGVPSTVRVGIAPDTGIVAAPALGVLTTYSASASPLLSR